MNAARAGAARPVETTMRRMLGAGAQALWRHRWIVVGVYLVSLGLSAIVGVASMMAIGAAFGSYPVFEHAMNGDVAALIAVLSRGDRSVWLTIILFSVGVGAAYGVLSWFLRGGLIAVFLENPTTGRARVFGAGGAAVLPAYFRLWLLSLVPLIPVAIVFGAGVAAHRDDLSFAVTFDAYAGALLRAMGPAAVLLLIATTATDYARIEISRHAELGALRGFTRGWRLVLSSWRPLAHAAALTLVGFAALYIYFAATEGWHPTTAAGALALCIVRQSALATRFACSAGTIAGQVEHARGRHAVKR